MWSFQPKNKVYDDARMNKNLRDIGLFSLQYTRKSKVLYI